MNKSEYNEAYINDLEGIWRVMHKLLFDAENEITRLTAELEEVKGSASELLDELIDERNKHAKPVEHTPENLAKFNSAITKMEPVK